MISNGRWKTEHGDDRLGDAPLSKAISPGSNEAPVDVSAFDESGQPPVIPAGRPDEAGDGCCALDAGRVLRATTRSFALRVHGQSMVNAGIFDGDIVIGEATPVAYPGSVVVALIDGESTLKRLVVHGGRPCLISENPLHPHPVAQSEIVIQGVVHTLVRRIV